jgi:thiamine biosynthesis lipoprotein
MLRRRFPAMGTQIELVLDAPPGARTMRALARAEEEFHRLERLLSRFDPESELSRLNERGTMSVGPELLEVASLAVDARRRTGGRFDPTVHDALVAAGYDRTFDRVPARAGRVPGRIAVPCGGAIAVDRAGSAIELEPGVRLDLGGIGKGYAADRAAALLAEAGPCLVDAGGDVALLGRPWPVGVETPDGTLTLELASGGLATSGRDRRRWTRGGREQHHLIDPTTGRPAESDVLRVTVAAPSAADAEVLAKALFFAGAAAALREANAEALPAVIVTSDGRTLRSEAIG